MGGSEACPACGHRRAEHVGRWCRVPTGAVNRAGQQLICCCEAVEAAPRPTPEASPVPGAVPGLAAVLAAHYEVGPSDTLYGWGYLCTCGSVVGSHRIHDPLGSAPPEVWAEHREHAAAAVLRWLTEAVKQPEVVEALAQALCDDMREADGVEPIPLDDAFMPDSIRGNAAAALAALPEALTQTAAPEAGA